MSSDHHDGVVPTVIVYPTMMGGFKRLHCMDIQKDLGEDDKSVVVLVNRMNKHYIYTGSFVVGVIFL